MYRSISAGLAKPVACALASLLMTFVGLNTIVAEGMKHTADLPQQQEVRLA